MESIFGPLDIDFWPLSNDRGIELVPLEVVIRSQGIDFRPLGSESRFFTHNVNFGPLLSDFGLLEVNCNSNFTYFGAWCIYPPND